MRIIHQGLGNIGLGIARLVLERGHTIVAAVDLDPAKAGQDLGALLEAAPLGVEVITDAAGGLRPPADILIHCPGSRVRAALRPPPRTSSPTAPEHGCARSCPNWRPRSRRNWMWSPPVRNWRTPGITIPKRRAAWTTWPAAAASPWWGWASIPGLSWTSDHSR